MPRYIDADKIPYFHYSGDDIAAEGVDYTLKGVIESRVPTEDVAPVVHAKWLIVEYEYLTCSCCSNYYYTGMDSTKQAEANLIDGEVPKYCPNCGARMD